ncbi:MAG: NUDIX hydrolase [Promicromonosporaceae bacterium]|nr:NUDIX hydrolase [Promicromonosporaceae bacterium]
MAGARSKDGDRAESASRPLPPGGSPLRVDPTRLRRVGGARSDSGVFRSLPPVVNPGHLTIVEETSAGGVVARAPEGDEAEPQVAVITRRNRAGRLEWCLPKGHLEDQETPEEAAVREVFEETGLIAGIRKRLGMIDYWFSGDSRRVHKVVHHYLMRMNGGFLTVEGDPDQEPEDVFWIPLSRLASRLSYPNEQKLATVAAHLLRDQPSLLDDDDGETDATK